MMKCKLCDNQTDSISGYCQSHIIQIPFGNQENQVEVELDMDEKMKRVFYPYNNLIDWALNRHT